MNLTEKRAIRLLWALYDDAIKSLSRLALDSYTRDLIRALEITRDELGKRIAGVTTAGMAETARIVTSNSIAGGVAFDRVHDQIVSRVLMGQMYPDGLSLDRRIWKISDGFVNDVEYMIAQGLAEKKSAVELADDLTKLRTEPYRRTSDWKKVYPYIENRVVDYEAMRLARTAINHAYQIAVVEGAKANPHNRGIKWMVANNDRVCDICLERDGQIYPVDQVPIDHPNGACVLAEVIDKHAGPDIPPWFH